MRNAAVMIFEDTEGNVLLLDRWEHDSAATGACLPGGKETTELPGGAHPEWPEQPAMIARREGFEETGFVATRASFLGVAVATTPVNMEKFKLWAFACTAYHGDLKSFPTREHKSYRWAPLLEACVDPSLGPKSRDLLCLHAVNKGIKPPAGISTPIYEGALRASQRTIIHLTEVATENWKPDVWPPFSGL